MAQEFSDHLGSLLSSDDRKKLVAAFLDLVDDETLAVVAARVESERKSRKKCKDSKGKKARENGAGHAPPSSVGWSSMEVISEASQVQSQTSPSATSRKTFAGDFPL